MLSPEFWAPFPSTKEQLESELDYIKRQSEKFNETLPKHQKMSRHRFPTDFSVWNEDGIKILIQSRRAIIKLRNIWANYTFK